MRNKYLAILLVAVIITISCLSVSLVKADRQNNNMVEARFSIMSEKMTGEMPILTITPVPTSTPIVTVTPRTEGSVQGSFTIAVDLVPVTIEPREFSSLEELQVWLEKDDTNYAHFICDPICIRDLSYDCDDYAEDLQKVALEDGFLVSVQIDVDGAHAFNSVFIGDSVYFIEPQSDTVQFVMDRD
jgi:hypothetical protein